MPDNRIGALYASGAIVLALTMRWAAPTCPLLQSAVADSVVADPARGSLVNLTVVPGKDGDQFTTTDKLGRHRVIRAFDIATAERYRLSVETGYQAANVFEMEIAGPEQKPYARIIGDLKTGTITERVGDMLIDGVEPVPGSPGRFRWWIDLDLPPGKGAYNFAILDYNSSPIFFGTPTACPVIFRNISLTPVSG